MNADALLARIARMQAAAGATQAQGRPTARPKHHHHRAAVTSRVEPWLALIEKRCRLLAEDRRFIRLRLAMQERQHAMRLAEGYSAAWELAASQEPRAHVKHNAGRQAANLWLKRQLEQ
ncbi:hypothetical protein [Vreelandella sp. TE19]